jgi:hypothetical protein
MENKT